MMQATVVADAKKANELKTQNRKRKSNQLHSSKATGQQKTNKNDPHVYEIINHHS